MKKLKMSLLAILLLFSAGNVYAEETINLEEVNPEETILAESIIEEETNEEIDNDGENRWATSQPEFVEVSEGITYSYEYKGRIKGQYVVDVVITIPETFENDELGLQTNIYDIFGNIQKENGIGLTPGDKIKFNITVKNNSPYSYEYEDGSFGVYPLGEKESLEYDDTYLQEEGIETKYKTIDGTELFNGEKATTLNRAPKAYNAAIKELLKNKSDGKLSGSYYNDDKDDNLNTLVDNALNEKGFDSLTDYYLDYYNKKFGYGTAEKPLVTHLSQFTDAEIASIISTNFYYRPLAFDEDGKIVKDSRGYYMYEYVWETDTELIELHFDYFYNALMGMSINEDVLDTTDKLSDNSIGSHMRDNSRNNDAVKESLGRLNTKGENEIVINLGFSGPYMNNTFMDYRFNLRDGMKFNVVKGSLIVNYVTNKGELLKSLPEEFYKVGDEYETHELEFDCYELIDVIGNETGSIIEGVTEVTYVYEFVGGIGGGDMEEIVPVNKDIPYTGVNDSVLPEILFTLSTLLLSTTLILRKKIVL